MRTYLILIGLLIASFDQLLAQKACSSAIYLQDELQKDPSLSAELSRIETFVQQQVAIAQTVSTNGRLEGTVIRIPVVVHVLYHLPGENISDARVNEQIEMLNKCYRRQNADTGNTPSYFKSRAADCEIEFHLATSDPQRRNTTGIIHKYTPNTYWHADDQMKLSAEMGDDPWDANNYLNIWVCNLRKVAGYASLPGGPANKDGVVIDYLEFGPNTSPGYELGRTAVHEIGHWLGLKHLWGDTDCGDDYVDDTPRQQSYNIGCPSGMRITCNNGPTGDMYMNYMDYTNDACMNLFTEGQKNRMRAFFAPGGPRNSILTSYGLDAPLTNDAPLPDNAPKWLHPQLYPDPVSNDLTIDLAYDPRWVGKIISVTNVTGQQVMQVKIVTKIQHIDVSNLRPGMYFISAKKEDGSFIKQKFIKI